MPGYPRGCRKKSSCVPWPRRLKRLLLVKKCSKTQSSYAGTSFAHLLRVNCASRLWHPASLYLLHPCSRARIFALPGNTIQPLTTPSIGCVDYYGGELRGKRVAGRAAVSSPLKKILPAAQIALSTIRFEWLKILRYDSSRHGL